MIKDVNLRKQRTAEQLYKFIEHFNDMTVEPQDDDIVTYYCKHKDDEGFIENTAWKDGGIEKLICRKWILQSVLDALFDNPMTDAERENCRKYQELG